MAVQNALLRLVIALEDKASAGLRGIQSALGGIADGAAGAARGFASFLAGAAQFAVGGLIQKGIEGIAASIGDLKAGMVDGNAEFERYGVQFGVLLGNAEAATQRLDELAQFGASTPFELPEVVRADKILQSFGLHAVEAAKRFGYAGTDIRRIAGDTAAGTGASFEEISTYIGKFASGATGETIARFQELGIVTKAELTAMGLAFDKGGSLIINSQEDLDRATGILVKSMEGKFGGMMAAQSATFEGMLSNLADWKAGTLRTIGEPIFDVLKVNLQSLLAWLPSQQPRIEAFAQSLAGGLAVGIERTTRLIRTLDVDFRAVANGGLRQLFVTYEDGSNRIGGLLNVFGMASDEAYAMGTVIGNVALRIGDGASAIVRFVNAFRGGGIEWVFKTFEGGSNYIGAVLIGFGMASDQAYAFGRAVNDAVRPPLDWLTNTGLPALQSGWAWLTNTALPAARAGFEAVSSTLSGPLTTAWGWLTGTGLPALQSGWGWLTDTGLPAARAGFEEVGGRISTALQPALDWLTGAGLPAAQGKLGELAAVFAPLKDALQPVIDGFKEGGLQGALDKIPGAIGPALQAVQDIRTELTSLALEGLGGLLTKLADMPQLSATLEEMGASGAQIEAVTGTLRTLGEILGTVGGWVRQTGQWFKDDLLPPLLEAGRGIAETVAPHLERLGGIIQDRIMPILEDFGRFIGENLPGFINVVSPLIEGLVDMGLSGLELALIAVATAWDVHLKPAFEAIGKWLEDLTGGWDNLARGADKIRETMGLIGEQMKNLSEGKLSLGDLQAGFGAARALGFPSLPGFAGGVSNFGGGLAVVGERGPELVRLPGGSDVIPAGGFSLGGGGGGTVVQVTVQGSVTSERDLVEAIRRGLIDIGRNNVSAGIP